MTKRYTEEDVIRAIRDEISESSLRKVAVKIGISAAYLSDVMRGNRAVSESVAASFGFQREIVTEVIFRKRAA
jgi:transcriptional regulator with XRE-family HTH domain